MRNARKVLLLAVMAVAAMAFSASTASAQIEVTAEGGGHCPAIATSGTDVDGGCLIHARSAAKVELRKHVFGIEDHIATCNNEFSGRVDEVGVGRIFEQTLDGAGCVRQPCKAASGESNPWVASGFEGVPQGVAEGTEFLTTTFCVEPVGGGSDETCEIDVPFQTYENQHRAEFGHGAEMTSHGISGFRCELVGHWNTELGGSHDGQAEQEVVVTH